MNAISAPSARAYTDAALGREIRVAHVCPDLDIEAAGTTQSVLRLCESLAQEGVQVAVHTNLPGRRPVGVAFNAHPGWRVLGRFGFSFQLVRALATASRDADILHNHSLWSGAVHSGCPMHIGQRCVLLGRNQRGQVVVARLRGHSSIS